MPKPVFRLLPASAVSPLLRTGLLLLSVLITTTPLQADSQPLNSPSALPALNIDLNQTSVSGISSGGFMAVQLHAAHASQIVGVGVFAGGPYQCAGIGNQLTGVGMALNVCMSGEADAEASLQRLADAYRNHLIDDPQEQRGDRVWLYSGYNDGVVKQPTMDALDQYYQQLTLPGLVYYKSNEDAGHAQIVDNPQAQDCLLNGGDFINNCAYDGAGLLLQHIYGSLKPRAKGALKGHILAFDQNQWASSDAGMAATAYLFVPADCEHGEVCRLHIAFHGCLQNAETIQDRFYRSAGYNAWADSNRLVVLYPQTTNSNGVRFNPKGCWDWWGYSDPLALQADYASRNSPQIRAVWNMAGQLASAFKAQPAPAESSSAAELPLTAADNSDRMIALHWPPPQTAATTCTAPIRPMARLSASTATNHCKMAAFLTVVCNPAVDISTSWNNSIPVRR
ncbi:extracellular catalytic domain type 2 short-chain-length polyhydroxyalkanoate depolymerase [Parathalassolituus penaei]|uniref:Poly(3-hydroxybutyrate) depolymerase n=1 Tax=Parathalassolituus penaei TaxID=2997323 RepID=A0A9X3IRP9_9GAMM|nr:PHB depolymerase family esterase [Parathalassolituus penaei]MCY0964074.1 hypothetical protein [Parathalassolituus penaei]